MVANRRASYLAGMSRSVGRGWPAGHFLPDLLKSTDGGITFKFHDEGIQSPMIRSIIVDPYRPKRVYSYERSGHGNRYTTNGGDTWIQNETPIMDNYGMLFAIDLSNSDNVYFTCGMGLYYSTDAGANWDRFNGQFQNAHVHGVAVHPFNGDIIYVGTGKYDAEPAGWGMFKTTNRGKSWISINNGFPDDIHVADVRLHPFDPDIVYLATRGNMSEGPDEPYSAGRGVFKSTNGGNQWNAVNIGLRNLNISALVINPQNPDILYVAATSEKLLEPIKGGVFKSTNGGQSWIEVSDGIALPGNYANDPLSIHHLAIDPAHPETLYAGAMHPDFEKYYRGAMFRTTNGGSSWHFFSDGLLREGSEYYHGIEYIDVASTGDVVYCAPSSGFVHKYGEFPTEDTAAPVMLAGPAITYKTLNSVTIQWHTHEKSTSLLEYGTSDAYGMSVQDDVLTLHHKVVLKNLDNSQTYHFRAGSADEEGNGPQYSRDQTFDFENDKQFPQIVSLTELDDTFESGPYLISTQVFDNYGVGDVKINYSYDNCETWQTMPMNDFGEGTYVGDIPGPLQTESSYIDYYMTATDISGNVTQKPLLSPYCTYTFQRNAPGETIIPYIYFGNQNSPDVRRLNLLNQEIDIIDLAYQHNGDFGSLAVSPDRSIVVRACGEKLTIINNGTGEIKGTVDIMDTDVFLGKCVITPDNKYEYSIKVSGGSAIKISVINLEKLATEADLEDADFNNIVDLGLSKDATTLYVFDDQVDGKTNLVVFDLNAKTQVNTMQLGTTRGFVLTDTGGELYTLTGFDLIDFRGSKKNTTVVAKIDLTTLSITDTLEITEGNVMETYDLTLNRKRNALLVFLGESSFYLVDTDSFKTVGHLGVGTSSQFKATNFALTEDDEYVYLPIPDDQAPKVKVLSLKDNEIKATLDIGMMCGDLVFTTAEIVNHPPLRPNLITPVNNDTIRSSSIQFGWSKSIDENSDVKYRLIYASDEFFVEETIISNLTDTTYSIDQGFEYNKQYWWKVIAEDGYGAGVESSETYSFISKMPTDVERQLFNGPQEFHLSPNYPNPFNAETKIAFHIPRLSHVTLKIYNTLGQEVRTLFDRTYDVGVYQIFWNGKDNAGRNLSSGVYFFRMSAKDFVSVKKAVLLE